MDMARTNRSAEDRRLTRVSKICLTWPEATRQDMGSHASFPIRKKVFAYFLNDHHGDGIVSIACKALQATTPFSPPLNRVAFTFPPTSDRGAGWPCVSTSERRIGKRSVN